MKKNGDRALLITILALIGIGIIFLSSASALESQEKSGNTFYYLNHQIIFGIIPGIILAWIVFKMKTDLLKKMILPLILINLFLLGMVFLPGIGSHFGQGANRWIVLGPLIFQPSEFLKISFILYLASWLKNKMPTSSKVKKNYRFSIAGILEFDKTFLAFFIILGFISLFLVLQPDVSTLAIIFLVSLIMYFLAEASIWQIFSLIATGIATLFILIKIAPYRMDRLLIFLHPELYPMGKGYQFKQALIAIGSGGLNGVGLGLSHQRFGFLPATMSDSIFAIFAEEVGFIGAVILIILFLMFFKQGFKISKNANDKFLQLAGFGITFWITIQAFLNISAMIGIMPLMGIPLPFISYGGSAIITELIGVGILLNISKHSKNI